MHSFAPMVRFGAALVMGWLLIGCGSERDVCEGNCPDVSGAFSLLAVQPLGECGFATYLPPPTLTITQTDNGRHVSTQLIDPVNQLVVSFEGNVLEPKGGDGDSGHFLIHTRGLRQAAKGKEQLFTLELMLSGTVTHTSSGRSLSSTLIEVQQEPADGSGCQITIPLDGHTSGP